ncbi:MAG: TraQ conjugal transfer family protein [Bacteroidota bacterium]
MKKIIPRSIVSATLLCFILILACSKDFENIIEDSFDFSFSGSNEEEIFIFEASKTEFSLEPERMISGVGYFMRYEVLEGKGHYLGSKGDTIRERDTIALESLEMNLNYMAVDTGAHKVKVFAWDSNKLTKEVDLIYNTRFASFSFVLTKGTEQGIINSKNPVNATLIRDKETAGPGNTGSSDFRVTYQLEDGTGVLYLGDTAYGPGEEFTLPKGVTEFGYQPETLGEHRLQMTAVAPDGAKITRELLLTVGNLDFSFRATAGSSQVELNTNLAVNIDLQTQDEDSDVTYEISHAFASESEGGGTVRDQNGGVMDPGTNRAILPGNYNYTFQSVELGKRKIYFDIRDSNGQSKRDSIEIEVANIPFTFSGNSERNSVFINERAQFNFGIRSNGNTRNIEYNISYEILEGNGTLRNASGTEMRNSTDYPVDFGNFSLFYFPETTDTHEISFVVTDNFGQSSEPVIIDLEIKQNEFEVTFTPSKTTEFTNVPVSAIINIDENPEGTNDTYEAFFTSGKSGQVSVNGDTYGPGEKFNLAPDTNTVFYTGFEPGEHNLVFSVESSSGVTHATDPITIGYEQVDFTFTGGVQKTEISIGEVTSVNFNISETVGSSDYTMRFTLNGNGLIKDTSGNTVSPGNSYAVPKGNFNWSLEGISEGSVLITFYARNDTGLEKPVEVSVTVTPKDYTFTANATGPGGFIGDVTPINFNITELGLGGDTYTMYYSTGNANSSFEFEGNTYGPGETFTVPVSSFSGNYTGLSEGDHDIVFNARSSSNVLKSAEVDIRYERYVEPFDLTISQAPGDRLEGEPFNVTIITNATGTHDSSVSYNMTFSFSGNRTGYFLLSGVRYDEGETVPLDYASTNLTFYPDSQDSFTIDFQVENSTGETQNGSTFVDTLRKPLALVKGEKHNVSCGGLNGCDYQVRIYTCYDVGCSEAYGGATLNQVEIRIFNRKDNRWDTQLFNYNEAQGNGVDRYFLMEEEPRESRLRYLDQDYEVRVRDTNGQWSERVTGRVVRV